MRINEFRMQCFKVKAGDVTVDIAGGLQGMLPDGFVSAKLSSLVGLACKVCDRSGKTIAELDIMRPQVTVDGAAKTAKIKATVPCTGDSIRAEVYDCIAILEAQEAIRQHQTRCNLGTWKTMEDMQAAEDALPTVEWTPTWEEQGELDFGTPEGELE